MKKTKTLIFGLVVVLLLAGVVNAECDNEIEVLNSDINMFNELGGSYIMGIDARYARVSKCYEKTGNHEKAVEMCSKCEEWGLKAVDWLKEVGQNKELFRDTYGVTAECYQYIHEFEKACKYCKESNKYNEGPSNPMRPCEKDYGCPKDSGIIPSITGKDSGNSANTSGDSGTAKKSGEKSASGGETPSNTGGFPIFYVVILAGILLLILLVLVLSRKKKEKQ